MTQALISLIYRMHLLGWQDIHYCILHTPIRFLRCEHDVISAVVIRIQVGGLSACPPPSRRGSATNQQQQQLGFVRAAFELVQAPALDLHDTVVLSWSRVRILILCKGQRGAGARAQ